MERKLKPSTVESTGGLEKGKWVWHDVNKQLAFERNVTEPKRQWKPIHPSRPTLPAASSITNNADRRVTLEDVKAVAIGYISTSLLQKMHISTSVLFDECYQSEQMDAFLWTTVIYFNAFLVHQRAQSDENIAVPGLPGEGAREALKVSEERLEQAKVDLGQAYVILISGLGNPQCHHSLQGRLKVSRTETDKDLYEAIYELTMYVTWITFSYEHWWSIHKELGRLFRTAAFNRGIHNPLSGRMRVNFDASISFSSNAEDSREHLSYRVYYDRPMVGLLSKMHSPAFSNLLPSTREKHAWAFESPYRPSKTDEKLKPLPHFQRYTEKLGIIGEQLSQFDPLTLKHIKKSNGEDSLTDLSELIDDDDKSTNDM